MTTFTLVHVLLSLAGIGTGLLVLFGLLTQKRFDGLTATFLVTTVATSITGFLLPFNGFTPAIGVGIVSMIVLAIAIYARATAADWRVPGGGICGYRGLNALAPTQTDPPLAIAQLLVLAPRSGSWRRSASARRPPRE